LGGGEYEKKGGDGEGENGLRARFFTHGFFG
jgi:hypothetical protein